MAMSRTARKHLVAHWGLLIAVLAISGCDRIESAIYQRAADRALAPDRTDLLSDGSLHVILCGTGSPLPDPDRAGPCAAVIAGGNFYLVDVGPGSWENVQLWRLPRAQLAGVLLTHFHSDHIGDLGEVVMQSWVGGRTEPLTVYGQGQQTRSFQYVDDLVAGLTRLLGADHHLPVNIGNPHEMTVLDFAERIIKLTGSKSKIVYKPLPEDDPQVRQPDIAKARKILDWEPRVDLDEGLAKTIEYFRARLKEQGA